MLISIVIPVFNEENLIHQILSKIDNIKNLNKEIIIVDDGSTDNTRMVIEENCKGLLINL